jgi:cytochrome c peroxidase
MRFLHMLGGLFVFSCLTVVVGQSTSWSSSELRNIRQLWIGSLGQVPADPTNAVANDPRAVTLGHRLFFDESLSEDGSVSCATCHNPKTAFADNNQLAEGRGTASRNTPSVIGSAFNRFQFWDGRADSLWAQALGPLESAVEHGTNRVFVARRVFQAYRAEYEAIFGAMPNLDDATRFPTLRESQETAPVRAAWDAMRPADQELVLRVFSNVGKAIGAYERLLRPAAAPFDQFAEALLETNDAGGLKAISPDAQAGLKLFVGKANCTQCHSNALFSDVNFYNTGVPINQDLATPDLGRAAGLGQLERSGFTCLSVFSDARNTCTMTRTALGLSESTTTLPASGTSENTATAVTRVVSSSNSPDDVVEVSDVAAAFARWQGAFKTPSLRNVARTAPYMHAGQIPSLRLSVSHYNRAPQAPVGLTQLQPLRLNDTEINQLVEFLKTLNSEVDAPARWLEAPR